MFVHRRLLLGLGEEEMGGFGGLVLRVNESRRGGSVMCLWL